ncbi:hypothetical protein [Paenibacillus sp. YIM B09110]|uniref:hypothetical protein n=1 Tax=Paenibacillus sp. YIM B09110 TaxID=3126102 RepID=UPI00301C5852
MINIYDTEQDQLAKEHYNEIADHIGKSRKYKTDMFDNWFGSFDSSYNLELVITAKPKKLLEIRNKCGVPGVYPDYIKYLVNMYENNFSLRKESIGNNGYNALAMTDRLGIRVCPLCNRNHIGNVDRGARGRKRTCQLDHFHSKSKYPFLAMSFFNLIPSCPSCNHTKGTDDIDASPYDEHKDMENLFRIHFNIKDVKSILDEKLLSVSLTEDPSVTRNADVLGLKSLYETHNDVAFEILQRFRLYSDLYREDVHKAFPGLFKSEDEIQNRLFGNYLQKENMKKQVLAKLKRDIYEQLQQYVQHKGAGAI